MGGAGAREQKGNLVVSASVVRAWVTDSCLTLLRDFEEKGDSSIPLLFNSVHEGAKEKVCQTAAL